MPALQPPHYDTVSALTMLRRDVLVSGGKSDKSLRAYDVSSSQVRYLGAVNNAHTDQINCLVSDSTSVFSGGKDGYIKVWRQDDIAGDLRCHASLDGNATRTSVNDLTLLDARFGQAVASAGIDKSIRIWQMTGAEDLGNNKIRDAIDRPMAPILT
jgi:WD40 repeat protein